MEMHHSPRDLLLFYLSAIQYSCVDLPRSSSNAHTMAEWLHLTFYLRLLFILCRINYNIDGCQVLANPFNF